MAELSEEQLKEAALAGWNAYSRSDFDEFDNAEQECWVRAMRAAALHLQMRWEDATPEEITYANTKGSSFGLVPAEVARILIGRFIQHRNSTLFPEPIDPRAEALHEALVMVRRSNAMSTEKEFEKATADILRILDDRGVSLDEEE
jgi:hypothetical protein